MKMGGGANFHCLKVALSNHSARNCCFRANAECAAIFASRDGCISMPSHWVWCPNCFTGGTAGKEIFPCCLPSNC